MVNVHRAVYDLLRTNTAITDIVSDRIYHKNIPQTQKTFPVLVYSNVSTRIDAKNLNNEVYQVSCWANTAEECWVLRRVVTSAIQGTKTNEIKSCVVDYVTEVFDTVSELHGAHITVKLKVLDLF